LETRVQCTDEGGQQHHVAEGAAAHDQRPLTSTMT
jgi:hypothetical protein